MKRVWSSIVSVALFAIAACGTDASDSGYQPPPVGGVDGGSSTQDGSVGNPSDGSVSPGDDDSSSFTDADVGPCTTTFTFTPAPGSSPKSVSVTGEWNAFANPGVAMVGPDGNGAYSASVELSPGLVGYKVVVDGVFSLDPNAWLRKYVGGVENSAVKVADCHVPTLTFKDKTITRASAGQGHFTAHVAFNRGKASPGVDSSTLTATLHKDFTDTPLAAPSFDASTQTITVDAPSLADGKYTVFVNAKDHAGVAAPQLRLVFWIEASEFLWNDAVIYMAMVDRFQDGDPSSNAPPTQGVDARADWKGGDLQGVTARINDGTFDQLGVRALWLSPFHQNPPDAFMSADGVHLMTGYHGYWPIKARGVEPRLGGDAALKSLVAAAHAHGIRILQDFVVNHVHQEHEYFAAHPEWFRTGCLCGTANCDWTTHRLDCLFASYLPDVNWTLPEVSAQYDQDAIWWADTFDLDGLRIDAVKHVEDACTMNLSNALRTEFEASGEKFFLTGETAMGWSQCTAPDCPGNEDNYGTISHYIGKFGLDGQTDFVNYYAVPSQAFMNDNQGMIHVDYWSQASTWEFPQGSIMTPYIGSQDTPRFATLADYRGQDAAHATSIPGNQWSNTAVAPSDAEPYARERLAMTWLLSQPGAPMVYYGDEYGEWGSANPNNRVMWRGASPGLSSNESANLAWVRKLGQARKELVAMRRGGYRPVMATESALVFARQAPTGEVALVAMNKSTSAQTITTALPVTLPLANGTTLHDRMGGANVSVTGGEVTITLGARSAAILAP